MIDLNTKSVLEAALAYAKRGWHVLPLHSIDADGNCTCRKKDCASPAKHPVASLVPNGLKNASTDEAVLRNWFEGQNRNIGIVTGKESGIVVLDVDFKNGGEDGLSELEKKTLVNIFDALNTLQANTGNGEHYIYKYAPLKNSVSILGQGLDIRGDGGYIVAAPSIHATGKVYEFVNDNDLIEFPSEWFEILSAKSNGHSNGNSSNGNGSLIIPPPKEGYKVPDFVPDGSKHTEFVRMAGYLHRGSFPADLIDMMLQQMNHRVFHVPTPTEHITKIVDRVTRTYEGGTDYDQKLDNEKGEDVYENTLQPYFFGEFMETVFEEKEILAFHIGKRDIAIIQAATNAGKTTLLRNICLCMAAGREFLPFFEGKRPVKIAYFDFENDAQDVQRDLKQMYAIFTDEEAENIKKNLLIIPKGLMRGELFQFNTHEDWANNLIQSNKVEFIIVDNVSAAYDLNDENSNAEVTKKIIKPLLKMAYKGNCAFLFAHHYGKSKNELESAGVHAGRGASALQSLSRTVINMFGDVSKGEAVTVECAKRKTDGGQNYTQVFKLEEDRWFHHTMIVPPERKKTAYQAIRGFLRDVHFPNVKTMSEIISNFENEFGVDSVKKAVSELYKDGFLDRPSHGAYCGKPELGSNPSEIPAPKNFYEKDED